MAASTGAGGREKYRHHFLPARSRAGRQRKAHVVSLSHPTEHFPRERTLNERRVAALVAQ
jgi:hypothetical protein